MDNSKHNAAELEGYVEFDPRFSIRSTMAGTKAPVIVGPSAYWVTRTPAGPGAAEITISSQDKLHVRCWGDGAEWMLKQIPALTGIGDDTSEFTPDDSLRQLWLKRPFKLGRTDIAWDAIVGAVLSQKVQVTKAIASRRKLARFYGELAPGPKKAWILPSAEKVAQLSYAEFHSLGVERKRAQTIIAAAKEMSRIKTSQTQGPEALIKRLESVKGIGPWTSALVAAVTLGYPDAVPVGDYHIPNTVAWLLAREERATDERMLALLEPYKGHRWRVIRIAKASGTAPKFGARLSLHGFGIEQGS